MDSNMSMEKTRVGHFPKSNICLLRVLIAAECDGVERLMIQMTLTFRLGDCVADFGLDVMLTVLGKDQGQAERTHTHTHSESHTKTFKHVCV